MKQTATASLTILSNSSDNKSLTKLQKSIIGDLLDHGAFIIKSDYTNKFYYEKPTGDRPSNFSTQIVHVSSSTVDSLFNKGWIKKLIGPRHTYEAVVPLVETWI